MARRASSALLIGDGLARCGGAAPPKSRAGSGSSAGDEIGQHRHEHDLDQRRDRNEERVVRRPRPPRGESPDRPARSPRGLMPLWPMRSSQSLIVARSRRACGAARLARRPRARAPCGSRRDARGTRARSPTSACHISTSVSNRFHDDRGRTRVPTRARACTSPLAARVLRASRSTVRDTPKRSSSSTITGQQAALRLLAGDDREAQIVDDAGGVRTGRPCTAAAVLGSRTSSP